MQFDLDLGPDEVAIQDAVARFCDYAIGKGPGARGGAAFSRELWRSFAELGVLEASREGGLFQACIALEVLGGVAFPGPLAQSLAAAAVLDEKDWAGVAAGERLAAFGVAPILAWGAEADVILVCDGERVLRLAGPRPPVDTLAETCSGRLDAVDRANGVELGPAQTALARYDMGVAAYVQGAGRSAVEAAADHARTRRQFGKSIGEFQAVAFPLVEARMGLDAARIITRFAALALDKGRADAPALAAAARLSATRAALKGCFAAHQTFGASGQLVDGPVAWLSRPIQELATQVRGPSALRRRLPLDVVGALDLDAWAH